MTAANSGVGLVVSMAPLTAEYSVGYLVDLKDAKWVELRVVSLDIVLVAKLAVEWVGQMAIGMAYWLADRLAGTKVVLRAVWRDVWLVEYWDVGLVA